MLGTAYDDAYLLHPGSPCIIECDESDGVLIVWWGKIISIETAADGQHRVLAEIDGGRFNYSIKAMQSIRTTECQGQTPRGRYRVLPETPSVCVQTQRMLEMSRRVREAFRIIEAAHDRHPEEVNALTQGTSFDTQGRFITE